MNKDFQDKVEIFKKELHALLKKYDVCIGVSIEGDTYGIDDETFYVSDIHGFHTIDIKTFLLNRS